MCESSNRRGVGKLQGRGVGHCRLTPGLQETMEFESSDLLGQVRMRSGNMLLGSAPRVPCLGTRAHICVRQQPVIYADRAVWWYASRAVQCRYNVVFRPQAQSAVTSNGVHISAWDRSSIGECTTGSKSMPYELLRPCCMFLSAADECVAYNDVPALQMPCQGRSRRA